MQLSSCNILITYNYFFYIFSYRFIDLFPDAHLVRDAQKELDLIIQQGILHMTRLLQKSEIPAGSAPEQADDFMLKSRNYQSKFGNDIYLFFNDSFHS